MTRNTSWNLYMAANLNFVHIFINSSSDYNFLVLTLELKIFAIVAYKLVKMFIINVLSFLIFLILSSKISEIASSFLLNKSLFSPKYWCFSYFLFSFLSNQIEIALTSLIFNFELSIQMVVLAWVFVAYCGVFFWGK